MGLTHTEAAAQIRHTKAVTAKAQNYKGSSFAPAQCLKTEPGQVLKESNTMRTTYWVADAKPAAVVKSKTWSCGCRDLSKATPTYPALNLKG